MAGGRPVRMRVRGHSVGHGGRQSDRGGALRWLDARGRVGGAGERQKESSTGEHTVADVGDDEVLLGRVRAVESLRGRNTDLTATRWDSLAGLGWLEVRWSSPGATAAWCGAEVHDTKRSGSG
jgi:hypothetical protein